MCIAGFEKVLYFTNNQVQMRLTAIETQLDAIQQKLEDNLQLFVPKRGRAYRKGESNTRKEADTYMHTLLDRLTYDWVVQFKVICLQFLYWFNLIDAYTVLVV